ncbi:MAG: BON domain-containing protein [Verrucomicrobiales bacterium]
MQNRPGQLFVFIALACFIAPLTVVHGADAEPDEAIALQVENSILRSSAAGSAKIQAGVSEGVVTLSGKVDNLSASKQAARLARRVAGVRSVVNQIVVEPTEVPDERLRRRAVKQLANDISFDASKVKVDIEGGKATLNGTVDSRAEGRLVEDKIAGLGGIRQIENNLEVAARKLRSDPEMQEIVSQLIDNSAILDESEIEVSVEDGVVKLDGAVDNLSQKDEAAQLASISGVSRVDGEGLLAEKRTSDGTRRRDRFESLTDQKIEDAIQLGIENHPMLVAVADRIDTSVEEGVVTLTGEVGRVSMKEAAAEVARNTVGVQGVENGIEVQWPGEPPSDQEIVKNLRSVFQVDAYLGDAEIIPRVRESHVHLFGAVGSPFEKRRAGSIAGSQPGVVHVANSLAVMDEGEPQPDEQIEETIREELEMLGSDPHVKVNVRVKDGVPVFTGRVATWFQWQALLRIAEDAGARRPHVDVDVHYRPAGASDGLYVPQ